MSLSLVDMLERARGRFRQDVADQLRMAADRAGLTATFTLDHERAVLRFDEALSDWALPCVIAAFDEDTDAEVAVDRVTLCVETGEERTTLLTLVWQNDAGLDEQSALQRRLAELEARTDPRVPLERRGLNAAADVRTGRYARGDVIGQLAGDLNRAAAQASRALERSHALVPVEPPRQVLTGAPHRGQPFEGGGREPQSPLTADLEAQRANVSELLISSLMHAMQRDLAESESHFVRPGVGASARGGFGRAMEWAMVGTAYGVEAKTNQMAVASFLGNEAGSWLYGLVGPVLIGGLASVSKSKAGKGAAYGLMMSWALAMATITASEKNFLDRAQGFFPQQAGVLTRQHALAAAGVRKEAAEAELKRLNAPAKETSALLADARKRWQASEIMRAAKRERERREKERAQARKALVVAGVDLNQAELDLRQEMLNDPSRVWAWWTLFSIFGVINLAGPLAISRVLERWRADHAEEKASAKDGHRKKSMAATLRGSRSAQKAHAMLLIPPLLGSLVREGVAPEVIARLDLGDIGQKAAERFDRGINGTRVRRSLFGPRGPAQGPPG